jgi:hypothetical protein
MAEADAAQIRLTGTAEAETIEAIGRSTAEAYKLQVQAMGEDNFSKFKITEEIGKNGIKIIPEILITGGNDGNGGGAISGLLGMELLNQIRQRDEKVTVTADVNNTNTSQDKQ